MDDQFSYKRQTKKLRPFFDHLRMVVSISLSLDRAPVNDRPCQHKQLRPKLLCRQGHHHCALTINFLDLGLSLSVRQGWPLSREDVRVETPPSLQVAQANSCISAHLFQGEVKLGMVPNLKEITFL